jgi:hypothetical protein
LALVGRVFGADAPTKDEAVWVLGREVGGVGDDSVEALPNALVLIDAGGGSERACVKREEKTYLEDSIDEKGVGVGQNKEGGVQAGGVLEVLNPALHGGVLETLGVSR